MHNILDFCIQLGTAHSPNPSPAPRSHLEAQLQQRICMETFPDMASTFRQGIQGKGRLRGTNANVLASWQHRTASLLLSAPRLLRVVVQGQPPSTTPLKETSTEPALEACHLDLQERKNPVSPAQAPQNVLACAARSLSN